MVLPCVKIHSSGHCFLPARTCHMNWVSTPEQQCCTPPSEAPGHKHTTTHTLGYDCSFNLITSGVLSAMRTFNTNLVYIPTSFFHTDLGEVELKGIISGQRDHETSGQVLRQRVAMVTEEQAVVTQWWHGNANLSQVVKILQHGGLRVIKERARHKDRQEAKYCWKPQSLVDAWKSLCQAS